MHSLGPHRAIMSDSIADIDVDELVDLIDQTPDTALATEATGSIEEDDRRAKKKARKEERRKSRHDRDRKKEKKRSAALRYIDDAASEGDDAESDDEDGDGEEAELVDDGSLDYIKNHKRHRHIFHEGDEGKSSEEIAREIEERNRLSRQRDALRKKSGGKAIAGSSAVHHEDAAELPMVPLRIPPATRFSAAFLPRPTDPVVFSVKVKPGMARILVARIVNKCYHYRHGMNDENKKVDLGIISAFALDHVKDYIYIESYRQLFVENALNGLVGLFRFNIKAVDPAELMQLLEHRPSTQDDVKVGDFVRVRQQPYRGDLGQVIDLVEEGRKAVVKLVPREDFANKQFAKTPKGVCHPKRFFDPNIAVGVHTAGERYRWGDLLFDVDGFLLRTVPVRSLLSGKNMVLPSMEELAFYFKGRRDHIAVAAKTITGEPSNQDYKLGEVVRVVSGQLANAVGTIVDLTISANTVKLACAIPGRTTPLEVRTELSNCIRHFVPGSRIGVESGPHQSRTGTVLKVSGDLLFVLADDEVEEIEVKAADCRQGRLVSFSKHTLGSWKLFDLVMLVDGVTVGCIVKCTTNLITILTDKNISRSVTTAQITRASKTAGRSAIDRMRNVVTRGCEVTIKAATGNVPSSVVGQSGVVEQLFNDTLFVRCASLFENSGVIAVEAQNVFLVGGRATAKQVAPPRQLPMPDKKKHYASRPDADALQAAAANRPADATEDWEVQSTYVEIV